jgi:hypothetical protein
MPAERMFAMTTDAVRAAAPARPAWPGAGAYCPARHTVSPRRGTRAGIVASWAAAILDGRRPVGAADLRQQTLDGALLPAARPLDVEGAVVYRDLTDGLDHITEAGPAVWMLMLAGKPSGHVMGAQMTDTHFYFFDPSAGEWRWRRTEAVEPGDAQFFFEPAHGRSPRQVFVPSGMRAAGVRPQPGRVVFAQRAALDQHSVPRITKTDTALCAARADAPPAFRPGSSVPFTQAGIMIVIRVPAAPAPSDVRGS